MRRGLTHSARSAAMAWRGSGLRSASAFPQPAFALSLQLHQHQRRFLSSESKQSKDKASSPEESTSATAKEGEEDISSVRSSWAQERETMQGSAEWREELRRHGSDDTQWHPSAWVRARNLVMPRKVSKTRRGVVYLICGGVLLWLNYELFFRYSHHEHVQILQDEDPVKMNRLREERVRAAIRLRQNDPEFDPTLSPDYQRRVEEDRRRLESIRRSSLRSKKAREETRQVLNAKLDALEEFQTAQDEQGPSQPQQQQL